MQATKKDESGPAAAKETLVKDSQSQAAKPESAVTAPVQDEAAAAAAAAKKSIQDEFRSKISQLATESKSGSGTSSSATTPAAQPPKAEVSHFKFMQLPMAVVRF